MGTGFLLLYKRWEDGSLSWPRNSQEAADLTEEDFYLLMRGMDPVTDKIRTVYPKQAC